jgi:hypothetical protein
MPAIDIGVGFGAALKKIEENLADYMAQAYGEHPDQLLTAVGIARNIEKVVGVKGLYLNPRMILSWVEAFEERTGRMILEKISDRAPQQYGFVYHQNVAYPGRADE